MASFWRALFEEMTEHADSRIPSGIYVAVSVRTDRVRADLRGRRRVFVDPDGPSVPLDDADRTADWVIDQAGLSAATLGGLAAFGGLASVPPEALASAIGVLRLAQRLSIVYGFDPETDRGQMAVWKALAAGLDVELPGDGPMQMRVRDVPAMIVPRQNLQSASALLARQVVKRSLIAAAMRIGRYVPLLAPGLTAVSSRSRIRSVGERMQAALRRLAEVPADMRFVEDATEVG